MAAFRIMETSIMSSLIVCRSRVSNFVSSRVHVRNHDVEVEAIRHRGHWIRFGRDGALYRRRRPTGAGVRARGSCGSGDAILTHATLAEG